MQKVLNNGAALVCGGVTFVAGVGEYTDAQIEKADARSTLALLPESIFRSHIKSGRLSEVEVEAGSAKVDTVEGRDAPAAPGGATPEAATVQHARPRLTRSRG